MRIHRRPRKSLRTLLIIWFLLFSTVPLAFITGYSLVKYEQAIDQELSKRLNGNAREISVILTEFEHNLRVDSGAHAADKALIYYLSMNNTQQARALLKHWLSGSLAHRMWLYNRDGRLEVALYKDADGNIQRKKNLESGDVSLNQEFLKRYGEKPESALLDIHVESVKGRSRNYEGSLDLVIFSRVQTSSGRLVGYLEEVITMDDSFLQALKNRLNAEIFFYQPGKPSVVATHDDLSTYKVETLEALAKRSKGGFFELNIRENPYRFKIQPVQWGGEKFMMGIGASKRAARSVLQNVNYAFFTVVAAIVLLLIILSIISSRLILRPIYQVLDAIERADFDKELVEIPTSNDTELGMLAESFNDLSRRTYESQKALKDKIQELEKANEEIRDTQAKLIHTAKMASLGQLVAGIAHELNNPIGFIYSNMSHLRDYSEKLIGLIDMAEKDPATLPAEKKKADLEYIRKDLPKLISSCEDGARRTRDIVLGLRNFSRLEEASLKEIDIHESLDNTLQLLTGELKNRIKVHKEFGDIPKVTCHPSQLNQVFMNILSNAAQAIEGNGEIFITTARNGKDKIDIRIRDTGKGMKKATIEKVFDPFFTTKTLGQGTGLGLSISYGVIQKHGGDILVDSKVGKGTEFHIILPIKNVA